MVAAVAVAANRMFKGKRLATLRLSIYAGGAIFLGIRFTAAGLGRLVNILPHFAPHPFRKASLPGPACTCVPTSGVTALCR